MLDSKGSPTPVERTLIRPPESRIGPLTEQERSEQISRSPLRGKYDEEIDRESAYELLKQRAEKMQAETARQDNATVRKRPSSGRQSVVEAMIKSTVRSIGSQLGRQIVRGILGSFLKR
jgi:hypothetical protein